MRSAWHWLLALFAPAQYELMQTWPQAREDWTPTSDFWQQNFPLWTSNRCVLQPDDSWRQVQAAMVPLADMLLEEELQGEGNPYALRRRFPEGCKGGGLHCHARVQEVLQNVTAPVGCPVRTSVLRLRNGALLSLQSSPADAVDRVAVVIERFGHNADPPEYAELTNFAQRFATRELRRDFPTADIFTTSTHTLISLKSAPASVLPLLGRVIKAICCPSLRSDIAEAELLAIAAELHSVKRRHPGIDAVLQEAMGSQHWYVKRRQARLEGLLALTADEGAEALSALATVHMGRHIYGRRLRVAIRSRDLLNDADTIRAIVDKVSEIPGGPQKTPEQLRQRLECSILDSSEEHAEMLDHAIDTVQTFTLAEKERLLSPSVFTQNGRLSAAVTVQTPRGARPPRVTFPFEAPCSLQADLELTWVLLINQLLRHNAGWMRHLAGNDYSPGTKHHVALVHTLPWFRSGFLVVELPHQPWRAVMKTVFRLAGYFRSLDQEVLTRVLSNVFATFPHHESRFLPGNRCRPPELATHPMAIPSAQNFQIFIRRYIHPRNMVVLHSTADPIEDAYAVASLNVPYRREDLASKDLAEFDNALRVGEKATKLLSPALRPLPTRETIQETIAAWKEKRGLAENEKPQGIARDILLAQRLETMRAAADALAGLGFEVAEPLRMDIAKARVLAVPGKVPVVLLHQPHWQSTRHLIVLRMKGPLFIPPGRPELRCFVDALGAAIEKDAIVITWTSSRSRAVKKFVSYVRSALNGVAVQNDDIFENLHNYCEQHSGPESLARLLEDMLLSPGSLGPLQREVLYRQTDGYNPEYSRKLWKLILSTISELELSITGPSTALEAAKAVVKIAALFPITRARRIDGVRLPKLPTPHIGFRGELQQPFTARVGATIWLDRPQTDDGWCFHKVLCLILTDIVRTAATRLYASSGFTAEPGSVQQTAGLQVCRITVLSAVPFFSGQQLPSLLPAIWEEFHRWTPELATASLWREMHLIHQLYYRPNQATRMYHIPAGRSAADTDWELLCAPTLAEAYHQPQLTLEGLANSMLTLKAFDWALEGGAIDYMGLERLPLLASRVQQAQAGSAASESLAGASLSCKDENQCRLLFYALIGKEPAGEWRESAYERMRTKAVSEAPGLFTFR